MPYSEPGLSIAVAILASRRGVAELGSLDLVNAMTIPALGKLERDPQDEEHLSSAPIPVSYFDGLSLPFVLRGIESDSAPADFERALNAFLRLGPVDRQQAGDYIFRLYRKFVEFVGKDDMYGFTIPNASTVWDFVTPTTIHLSRRHHRDKLIYIEICAECRWDEEHGLVVIYRGGSTLSRVSEQDGHLTTSDACGSPDEQDTIIDEA